jgi:antitoxin ParD1/3/4
MASVVETIQVPAAIAADLDALVADGVAPSREAVVANLVAREIEEAARRKALDAAIDEGLASPSSGMTVDEIMAEFRQRHGRS